MRIFIKNAPIFPVEVGQIVLSFLDEEWFVGPAVDIDAQDWEQEDLWKQFFGHDAKSSRLRIIPLEGTEKSGNESAAGVQESFISSPMTALPSEDIGGKQHISFVSNEVE